MTRKLARMIAALRLRLAWHSAQLTALLQPPVVCPNCFSARCSMMPMEVRGHVQVVARCEHCKSISAGVTR